MATAIQPVSPISSQSPGASSVRQFLCLSCQCRGNQRLFRLWFFISAEGPLSACDELSVEWLRLRQHLRECHHDDLQHFLSASKRVQHMEKDYLPSQSEGASQFFEFFCRCTPHAGKDFHSYLWCSTDSHGRPKEFLKPTQISVPMLLSVKYSYENLQEVIASQIQARAALKAHVQQAHANDFQDFFSKCDWFRTDPADEHMDDAQTPAVSLPDTPSPSAGTSLMASSSSGSSSPSSSSSSVATPSSGSQLSPLPRFALSHFQRSLSSSSSNSAASTFSSSSVFSSSSIASDVVELESALLGLSEDEVRRLKRNEAEAKRRKGESDAMMALAVLVEGSTALHNRSDRLTIMRKSANALQSLQNKVDQLQAHTAMLEMQSNSSPAVSAVKGADDCLENRKRKHSQHAASFESSEYIFESAMNELRQTVSEAQRLLSGVANDQSSLRTAVETVREASSVIRTFVQRSETQYLTAASAQRSASTNSVSAPFLQHEFPGIAAGALLPSSQSLLRVSPLQFGNSAPIAAIPAIPAKKTPSPIPIPNAIPIATAQSSSRPGGDYMFTWADTPLIIDALKNFSRSHNALIIFSRDSVRGEEQWATVARELNEKIAAIRDGHCAQLHSRRVFNRVDSLKRRHFQKASQDAISAAHSGLEGFLKNNAVRLMQVNSDHGSVLLNSVQLRTRLEQMIFLHQSGGVKSFAVGFQSAEDIRDMFGNAAPHVCKEIRTLFDSYIKKRLLMKDYDAYRWALELYQLSRIKLSSQANIPQQINDSSVSHMQFIPMDEKMQLRQTHGNAAAEYDAEQRKADDIHVHDDLEEEEEMLAQQTVAFEETDSESERSPTLNGGTERESDGAFDGSALKKARTDAFNSTTERDAIVTAVGAECEAEAEDAAEVIHTNSEDDDNDDADSKPDVDGVSVSMDTESHLSSHVPPVALPSLPSASS